MPDRPLRIAADARSLNTEHLRGIGKSLYELVKRTAASGDRMAPLAIVPTGPCSAGQNRTRRCPKRAPPRACGNNGRCRASSRPCADCTPATTMPWWQPVPSVVTVHDTIPAIADGDSRHRYHYWVPRLPEGARDHDRQRMLATRHPGAGRS
jgi:hypothetical protein